MIKENEQKLISRPPVVVILGHVDHGKSSILEKIKDLKITEKESGGITQHIGAYEIEHNAKKIAFIDTPGHEAFDAMRSRGAKVADIAILVIAAEEGVKPQTKEAISHIKKAGIPMIIAFNKIDKPGADPEKIKRELVKQDILVESMGGRIPSINTSAETGQGISDLIDLILLVAEMEDLKTDLSASAQGVVIESYLDSNRGATTTLILKNGVLNKGDILATNSALGRIRTMEDFQGNCVNQALPSLPVIIIGFETGPGVGEEFKVFSDIEQAEKQIKKPEARVFKNLKDEAGKDKKVLNLILKIDVLGSLEAIESVLKDIPQEKVLVNILKAGAGEINDSDVRTAKTFNAKIVGFRVKTNQAAQKLALREKITIMNFEVIYELAQAVRQFLEKKVGHEIVKTSIGKIKILAIFKKEKNNQIVGGKVMGGEVKRGVSLEVYRDEELAGKGKIAKLQQDKKDVDQVAKGRECGILFSGDVELKEGDILEAYIEERVKGEL
ncbi:MAG: translation initiation factor IF-2 [bacterium]|nr:translation initiation factor IF-2 [bacterium]